MPDPNEIAAAAERLRRVKAGKHVPEYDVHQNLIGGVLCRDYLNDLMTLAAAYLAEHADEHAAERVRPDDGAPGCVRERVKVAAATESEAPHA